MPILLQMPIFLSLFRLIDNAANGVAKGVLTQAQVEQIQAAEIFGAGIADRFTTTDSLEVRILAGFLVLAMTATTFLTQRQLMSKNMPADAMQGPYARQQKMLLYVLPVVFAVGGIAFPIGVIIYWTTSNLWTMGQQFYVIRNNPAPGTPAFRAKQERDKAKAIKHGKPVVEEEAASAEPPPNPVQPRVQPKRQSRSQRKKGQSRPRRKPPS
jgi:YidC/Oxa1 family membrane protein insertase